MTQLVLSDALLATLRQAQGPTELCDNSDNVVGYYAPAQGEARHPLDPAALEGRKAPGRKSFTTRQAFEHLKSITPDEETRAYLQQKIDALPE
jgi:hypothetical protein